MRDHITSIVIRANNKESYVCMDRLSRTYAHDRLLQSSRIRIRISDQIVETILLQTSGIESHDESCGAGCEYGPLMNALQTSNNIRDNEPAMNVTILLYG